MNWNAYSNEDQESAELPDGYEVQCCTIQEAKSPFMLQFTFQAHGVRFGDPDPDPIIGGIMSFYSVN